MVLLLALRMVKRMNIILMASFTHHIGSPVKNNNEPAILNKSDYIWF